MSGQPQFAKVLVANRGEIAVRIFRTLRDLGICPVAVYSEPDRHALHVRMADEAVCIGPEASSQSYLDVDAVLGAARQTGAEAIHPGYGFLSENADFARRVAEAGLVWIGPPPHAITTMGDKLLARRTVTAANVPVVPGTQQAVRDADEALAIARDIGFPVMIKASAGGGGKGMRLVRAAEDFIRAADAARREAMGAFGDDSVYVEKFIERPHHIEIQVVCDAYGHAVHLGERECSVQRRHQKVVEECPSPFVTSRMRAEMGAVAVAAARACDYVGAGTVEFMVGADRSFYFLEMNTRLQVEHPVTELVYGVDLVDAQIRVAAGEPLPFDQASLEPRGHAIECRIYAEDPETYLPSPGPLRAVHWPGGPGIRVDAGVDGRSIVPMAYDPLIAKMCAHGRSRDEAMRRMRRALDEAAIVGITTNIALHRRVLAHPAFAAGEYDTGILDTELPADDANRDGWKTAVIAAAALARFGADKRHSPRQNGETAAASSWRQIGRWHTLGRR